MPNLQKIKIIKLYTIMKKIKIYYLCLLCIPFIHTLKAQETNTVIDGKARFIVLTPTLIRTEYAGDSIFESKNSFNITNLNLPTPAYSTTVNNGWREIKTEKVLLRYKQNSGVFDSTNLTVSLNVEDQPVVAKPWSTTFSGYRDEAENAALVGAAKIATDHINYTGSGFVAGLKTVGSGLEWSLKDNLPAGDYMVSLRYSNGMGSPRTISLYVDNVKTQILLDKTTNWDAWSTFQQKVKLGFGSHTIKVLCDTDDNYNVNIDWINITPILNFNQICEAEEAVLAGGVSKATDHIGFTGSGFAAGLIKLGADITWNLNNSLTAGDYTISFKYTNGIPSSDGLLIARTLSLYIDNVKTQITFDPTTNWDTWSIFQKTVQLSTGPHTIRLSCDQGDAWHVNVDWLAVSPAGSELPKPIINSKKTNIGAWSRGLDTKNGAIPLWDGILSQDGWYLLDDSQTALNDGNGWVVDRSVHAGGYQDGYFFGYGTDFQTALKDFYKITGNPMLLPKWAFGVWYSINEAASTTSSYYQNTLIPQLRSEKVPLDVLVVDTDWKSPDRWDSWSWNTTMFPDPQDFLNWTKTQGLVVPLNIHPTIQGSDAKFAKTNATAGGLISQGGRYHFDFSNKKHAQAYFDLHQPFNDQGARFWWFDQAEYPHSAVTGAPADTWINSLYAKDATDRGLRGFAFSRIGSGCAGYSDSRKPGTGWSEHRYTLHFTGDAFDTWNMLAFQSTFTIKEANIGIPYVSHDLGSYHADLLSDDMYMRWVQFGTFQPIFRLHSKRGKRLPWQYPNVSQQAKGFIRLRHALVPYTYSLAHESSTGGMPIVRGMYFYYPTASEAYSFDKQYFYGEKVLVSPIVTPGATASTQVWFPEGTWTNYFTNATVIGPAVKNISADYSSMPVFVKAGGIIPLAPYSDYIGQSAEDTLTLKVYTGDDGEFTLYEDEGENLNFQTGKSALTKIVYNEQQRKLSIKAQKGNYTGAPEQRSYDIVLYNTAVPQQISVNGVSLNVVVAGVAEGWWISNGVIYIHLNKRSVAEDIDVIVGGFSNIKPLKSINKLFKLYPNPAENLVTVELSNTDKASIVTIYDNKGENVFHENIASSKKKVIDTRLFSKGTYLVTVENEGLRVTEKLLIE